MLEPETILDALNGRMTAKVLADHLDVDLRELVPALNCLWAEGEVIREVGEDARGRPIARWLPTFPPPLRPRPVGRVSSDELARSLMPESVAVLRDLVPALAA